MRNVKIGLIMVLLLSLIILPQSFARAEEVTDPGFREKYVDFLNQLPPPTPLNGGESSKVIGSFPSQRFPFSVFKLELKNKKDFVFNAGEKLELTGELEYQFKGNENLKKIETECLKLNENDKEACKTPQILSVSEWNQLGVFVQVWKKDESEMKDKGDFLVDEFYATEEKSLKENERISFPIKWNIPAGMTEGDYYLLFFVNQNKYFDISGNPLTVFSEAERFDFGVKGEEKGIELDKDNIKINNLDYAYRRPAPTVEGENVTITLPLKNLGLKTQQANIIYELYRWGRTSPTDLIDTKKETKTLNTGANETLNYTFKPNAIDSLYDLKIKVKTEDSVTSSYVRFVMKDKKRGVLRFLSTVKEGNNLKPFFCLRNANWDGIFKGKVRLSLNNQLLLEEAGSMEASEENCFVTTEALPQNNDCNVLRAEILDEQSKVTDMREVSFGKCGKTVTTAIPTKTEENNNLLIIIALILAIISIGGIIILKTKVKK